MFTLFWVTFLLILVANAVLAFMVWRDWQKRPEKYELPHRDKVRE